jgi:serine protease Do
MKKSIFVGLALVAILALIGWAIWPQASIAARSLAQTGQATPTPQASTTPPATTVPATTAVQEVPGSVIDLQAALQNLYEEVSPSVVNINVLSDANGAFGSSPGLPELPFGHPDLPETPDAPRFAASLGSGFVWDAEGHIVTNNHVVGTANRISVTFSDGLTLRAELVGRDPESDLAVIKVDPTQVELRPVEVGDSTQLRVGQFAVAIGNPFGLEGSMTFGIVSALGRTLPASRTGTVLGAGGYTIPDIIQTDAPVNPGNSGGALLDLQGRLVGVPTAIESPVRASSGVGFAVPSVIVQKVVPVLIEDGEFEHPYIGISGGTLRSELAEAMDLPATQRGALVVTVVEGGPAEEAGLRGSTRQVEIDGQELLVGGDVIVAVDGQPVNDFEDLTTYLARSGQVGQAINVTVLRDGRETSLAVTLRARPSQVQVQLPREPQTTGGAWLGINGMTVTPEVAEALGFEDVSGVLILSVVNNSPADEAGLRGSDRMRNRGGQQLPTGGDIVTAVDGEELDSIEALVEIVQASEPGDEVTLTILRDGETEDVTVTLGQRP